MALQNRSDTEFDCSIESYNQSGKLIYNYEHEFRIAVSELTFPLRNEPMKEARCHPATNYSVALVFIAIYSMIGEANRTFPHSTCTGIPHTRTIYCITLRRQSACTVAIQSSQTSANQLFMHLFID